MSQLFIVQLIASFVVGGTVITLLSFIAERAPKHIAGIILVFPTTSAVGLFFLGWTVGNETTANIIPGIFIPLGLSIVFAALYCYSAEYFSRKIRNKFRQIALSFIVSIGLRFAIAIPLVVFRIHSLWIGLGGYIALTAIAHIILHRRNHEKPPTLHYTFQQKAIRSFIVATVVFLVVLLGKTLGPLWGATFAMFPALFSSFMIILHTNYGSHSLFPAMQKVAFGSLSVIAYLIVVMITFPMVGFIIGTILAYLASLIVALGLMRIQGLSK